MPALCHVRLGGTTLKPCESFAVCGTRLSLPHVLRSTHYFRQHDKGTPDAKVALDRFKNGPNGIESSCSDCTAPLHVVDRARRAFHSGEHEFGNTSLELQSENPAHLFMNARQRSG